MIKIKKTIVFWVMLNFCFVQGIFAKISFVPGTFAKKSNQNLYWINLGLGVASTLSLQGAGSAVLNITYKYEKKTLLSARFIYFQEIMGDPEASEIGLLYGRINDGRSYLFSRGIGLGLVEFQHNKDVIAIGVTLELQLFYRPCSFLGFGLYSFANLNLVKSFGGICLCLQIIGKYK